MGLRDRPDLACASRTDPCSLRRRRADRDFPQRAIEDIFSLAGQLAELDTRR